MGLARNHSSRRSGAGARDLTQGPIARGIATFTLPLLGSSLVQLMYSMVDALFAGNALGAEGIAAVGASSLAAICQVSFFTGLSVGANVLVARRFGSGDNAGVASAAATALALAVAGGIVVAAIGFALSPALSSLMAVPANVFADATLYLQVYFLGVPFIVVYNMSAGVLRGVGDSRTPLVAQVVGGIANVALDALFVLVLDFGVAGIAWATFIAQGIACAWATALVLAPGRLATRAARPDAASLSAILKVGVPCGLQSLAVTLSNAFVQSVINAGGSAGIAAFTAYFKLEMFIYEPVLAIGQAATVFTAQNMGAGRNARVQSGVRCCLGMACGTAVAVAGVLLALAAPAFGLFTSDSEVVSIGVSLFFASLPFYWLYAIVEVYAGASRGTGHASAPMLVILCCYAVGRVVLLRATPLASFGDVGVVMVFPITWAVAAALMFTYYWLGVRPGIRCMSPHGNGGCERDRAQVRQDNSNIDDGGKAAGETQQQASAVCD